MKNIGSYVIRRFYEPVFFRSIFLKNLHLVLHNRMTVHFNKWIFQDSLLTDQQNGAYYIGWSILIDQSTVICTYLMQTPLCISSACVPSLLFTPVCFFLNFLQACSIWSLALFLLQERIAARRDRIKQRMDQARKMTKLLKIKNMMGFKVVRL